MSRLIAALVALLVVVALGWAAWTFVVSPVLRSDSSSNSGATPSPSSQNAAQAEARRFLALWSARRYAAMYDELDAAARHRITRMAFTARYQAIAREATITGVQGAVNAATTHGITASVDYTVTISTSAVGPISYAAHMPLRHGKTHWRVDWTPDLIFPGLGSSYRVHLYDEPARRGDIVDRRGDVLATDGYMIPVGVVPQYIGNEKELLSFLSGWLHMPRAQLHAMIHVPWAQQNPSDFVPIATVSSVQWNAVPQSVQVAEQQNGLDVKQGQTQRVLRRLYPHGSFAGPLLGYIHASDGTGAAGLEAWGNRYVTGSDGAKLAIATAPDYSYVMRQIKDRPAVNGATLHLTLDVTLQEAAEQALAGKVGAVVAIRPSDGAVLALASSPGFDPSVFAMGISSAAYKALLSTPGAPLLDKAALGEYPPGSLFKVVTAGAALEKGGETIDSVKPCPGVWYGLGPQYPKANWLASGQGMLTMHEALVQSCDPYFYQVGLDLNRVNGDLLPAYARAWGLGAPTGIVGVAESAGLIPDPRYVSTALKRPWVPGDAVDMAIGQGDVEVSPLQMAQIYAALGDGGTVHRPYVVAKITTPTGAIVKSYAPTVSRTLPLSAAHLHDILSALRGVISEPAGTAAPEFAGFPWPVAGKTGTAQTGDGRNPDAWFAALAPADKPSIVLIVMVEHVPHGGEGATVSAPLARQILKTYFTKDADLAGASGPTTLNVP